MPENSREEKHDDDMQVTKKDAEYIRVNRRVYETNMQKVGQLERQVAELKAAETPIEVELAPDTISELRDELDRASETILMQKDEIRTLKGQVNHFSSDAQQGYDMVDDMEARLAREQKKVEELEAYIDELTFKGGAVDAADFGRELEEYRESFQRERNVNENLRLQIAELEARVAEEYRQYERERNENQNLRLQVAELEDRVGDAKEERRRIAKELLHLKGFLRTRSAEVDVLANQRDELREEVGVLQERIQQLKGNDNPEEVRQMLIEEREAWKKRANDLEEEVDKIRENNQEWLKRNLELVQEKDSQAQDAAAAVLHADLLQRKLDTLIKENAELQGRLDDLASIRAGIQTYTSNLDGSTKRSTTFPFGTPVVPDAPEVPEAPDFDEVPEAPEVPDPEERRLKVQISGSGSSPRTYNVLDAETGEPLHGITKATVVLDADDDLAHAYLDVVDMGLDVELEADVKMHSPGKYTPPVSQGEYVEGYREWERERAEEDASEQDRIRRQLRAHLERFAQPKDQLWGAAQAGYTHGSQG